MEFMLLGEEHVLFYKYLCEDIRTNSDEFWPQYLVKSYNKPVAATIGLNFEVIRFE